jgi:malate synthase A
MYKTISVESSLVWVGCVGKLSDSIDSGSFSEPLKTFILANEQRFGPRLQGLIGQRKSDQDRVDTHFKAKKPGFPLVPMTDTELHRMFPEYDPNWKAVIPSQVPDVRLELTLPADHDKLVQGAFRAVTGDRKILESLIKKSECGEKMSSSDRREAQKLLNLSTLPQEETQLIECIRDRLRVLSWRTLMLDLEDSLCPMPGHLQAGLDNIRKTLLSGEYDSTFYTIRPPSLHIPTDLLERDQQPISAALMSFSAVAFWAGQRRAEGGVLDHVYLYLPKLHHPNEAVWWNEVMTHAERALGLPENFFKVTVLNEVFISGTRYQEAIGFALKDRIIGMNTGRYDYTASEIRAMMGSDYPFADRDEMTMGTQMMQAYALRMVELARHHGYSPVGGMSAFLAETDLSRKQVVLDKGRERTQGMQGAWMATPALFGQVEAAFSLSLSALQDTCRSLGMDLSSVQTRFSGVEALYPGEFKGQTEAGIKSMLDVMLVYITAYSEGKASIAYPNDGKSPKKMEDAATYEIARALVELALRNNHDIQLHTGEKVPVLSVIDQWKQEALLRNPHNAVSKYVLDYFTDVSKPHMNLMQDLFPARVMRILETSTPEERNDPAFVRLLFEGKVPSKL